MPSSLLIILAASIGFAGQCMSHPHPSFYKNVAMFSVDGLHPSDVEKYVALRPQSTIAKLLKTAYDYTSTAVLFLYSSAIVYIHIFRLTIQYRRLHSWTQ